MPEKFTKNNKTYILASLHGIQRKDYIEYTDNLFKIFYLNSDIFKDYIDNKEKELEKIKHKDFNSINDLKSNNSSYSLENSFHRQKTFRYYLRDLIKNKIPKMSKKEAISEIDKTLDIMDVIFCKRSLSEIIVIEIPEDLIYKELKKEYNIENKKDIYSKKNKKNIMKIINNNYYYAKDHYYNLKMIAFYISNDINKINEKFEAINDHDNVIRNHYIDEVYLDILFRIEEYFSEKKSLIHTFKSIFNNEKYIKEYFLNGTLRQFSELLKSSYSGIKMVDYHIFKSYKNEDSSIIDYIDDVLVNKITYRL